MKRNNINSKNIQITLIVIAIIAIVFTIESTTFAATNDKTVSEFQMVIDFLLKILPLAGWLVGAFAWWDTARGKKFAAEEDFRKIKERLENVSKNQEEITELIRNHEQKTFTNFTAQTNQIFSELKELHNDLQIIKQLINNIQILISPNINISSGFKRND